MRNIPNFGFELSSIDLIKVFDEEEKLGEQRKYNGLVIYFENDEIKFRITRFKKGSTTEIEIVHPIHKPCAGPIYNTLENDDGIEEEGFERFQFAFLTRSQLEPLLKKKNVDIYPTKLKFGRKNHSFLKGNYWTLRIESHGEPEQTSTDVPPPSTILPLFQFALPCPPKWGDTVKVKLGKESELEFYKKLINAWNKFHQ